MNNHWNALLPQAERIIAQASQKHIKIATAESCTGGLIAAILTEIPGSSSVFERGFSTYSNNAKVQMLGVSHEKLEKFGAVSEHVAIAMAQGALEHANAQLAIAVTGVAGPGGGSVEKPVGCVHLATASINGHDTHFKAAFPDKGRHAIRLMAVEKALEMLHTQLDIL